MTAELTRIRNENAELRRERDRANEIASAAVLGKSTAEKAFVRVCGERDAEKANKESAREHWGQAQNRLAAIEGKLIAITGTQQSINDNIDGLVQERDRLRAVAERIDPARSRASGGQLTR